MIFVSSIKHQRDEVLFLENDDNEIKDMMWLKSELRDLGKGNRSSNWKAQEFYEVLEM